MAQDYLERYGAGLHEVAEVISLAMAIEAQRPGMFINALPRKLTIKMSGSS